MLAGSALTSVVARLTATSFSGTLYRAIHLEALYGFHRIPPYPEPRPLYSLGAPRSGARFTPIDGPASLYLAEDPETAYAEANRVFAAVRAADPKIHIPAPPTVLVSATVVVETVLDLTDGRIRSALKSSDLELQMPWRTPTTTRRRAATQRLGLAAYRSGRFAAIRYPSVQLPGHSCFVIFPDRLTNVSFVEVFDPDGNLRERIP